MTRKPQSVGVGVLLQSLIDGMSHRGGETLVLMNDASVTLPQVLLLTRLRQTPGCTMSELAEQLNLSLPAVSQAIDRLVRGRLAARKEDREDRRRKRLVTTDAANALLDRLIRARAREFEQGAARLSGKVRADLTKVLRRAVAELG
ncbi:MAG TPA: MarR family transcriptional regulator [Gemmatimonadaceae bacterium]|nr:MarR family transcriptional regulator [Gemmatimonadaceae bacterium]